jgi:hypothetical protein
VDLRKVKATTLTRNRKYQIVCNIVRPWELDFKVESLVLEQDIPFEVDGEEQSFIDS